MLSQIHHLVLLMSALFAISLQGATSPVPAIRTVGAIPVQWKGEIQPLSSLKPFNEYAEKNFSKFVRESKRFRVLGDQIIMKNWSTPDGRMTLDNDFELDAYLSLEVEILDDVLVLTTRMLGPELNSYLMESDRVLLSWIQASTLDDFGMRLRNLVFRMLNRYPIDVFVTSIQGSYVTISGGKNQNLYEGDQLDIYDVQISQIHPIDGTWLSYKKNYLGKILIVDSKSFSAIGRMIELAYEGAIVNGTSATLRHINSRKVFADQGKDLPAKKFPRLAEMVDSAKSQGKQAQKRVRSEDPKAPIVSEAVIASQTKAEQIPMEQVEDSPEVSEPVIEHQEAEPEYKGEGFWDRAKNSISDQFDLVHVVPGLHLWSSRGTASASAKFPFWLVNSLGVEGFIGLEDSQKLRLGGNLSFGPESNGSFFGLGLNGSYLYSYEEPGLFFHFVDGYAFGPLLELSTLQVSGSSYGGYDALTLGGEAHLYGRYHLINMSRTIEGDLFAKLRILSFGQVGLAGSTTSISGVFGYELGFSGILKSSSSPWEWGGRISYRSDKFSVSSGSFSQSDLGIELIMRHQF